MWAGGKCRDVHLRVGSDVFFSLLYQSLKALFARYFESFTRRRHRVDSSFVFRETPASERTFVRFSATKKMKANCCLKWWQNGGKEVDANIANKKIQSLNQTSFASPDDQTDWVKESIIVSSWHWWPVGRRIMKTRSDISIFLQDHNTTKIKQDGYENYMAKSSNWIELITSSSPISPGEERNGFVIHSMLSLKETKESFQTISKTEWRERMFSSWRHLELIIDI